MMASFDVAHVREQDIYMVIVVVDPTFGTKTKAEQGRIVSALQIYAGRAGLVGQVVPVWEAGAGKMGFLAPDDWHGYFARLSFADVSRNINRKLVCA